MKRILVSGATGLIGKKLVEELISSGYAVNFLTTRREQVESRFNYQGFYWNPAEGEIDERCFEGVSAIINLAGAPIAKRWTKAYKETIINSRTASINLIYDSLSRLGVTVDHFISASAIGYYPASEVNYYEESYVNNEPDYVAHVVSEWEDAADRISELDIPLAKVRIGLVLSEDGGALEKIAKPIKTFVGSVLGTGDQWQSWIHIDDIIGIFTHILENRMTGIYNAVAPNPVTHKVLVRQIAKTLRRPLILPKVPVFALKLLLGEMHTIVTSGQRVSSKKIEAKGYHFKFYQLKAALEDLLGK